MQRRLLCSVESVRRLSRIFAAGPAEVILASSKIDDWTIVL
jgi:hypothetical protein